MAKIVVIGSGFSSLSAACYLARDGHEVVVCEKNAAVGGRAGRLEREGFRFDTGPSFYWMPDVFERFFADFGRAASDFYRIRRLDPGYRICFGEGDWIDEWASLPQLLDTFERIEPGSGAFLKRFLRSAAFNYRTAMEKVVHRPGESAWELVMPETAARLGQFAVSLRRTVRRHLRDERLCRMLEFPSLFLGAKPGDTPSFYRFMNHADLVLGTWHVEGGLYEVALALRRLAESLGVRIETDAPVERIATQRGRVTGVETGWRFEAADAVVSGADYRHTETLLPEELRNYTEEYWRRRVFAPSALLYYIGFGRKLEHVRHHTLFFDAPFDAHAAAIYDRPGWAERPLFYASFPTVTDPTAGPAGREGAVVLIPTAPGMKDTPAIRERYFDQVLGRMERITGQSLRGEVLFRESYAASDFIRDFNAAAGNAYGLANTLRQTAFLRPRVRNRHLRNLFFCGQLTVPGPGLPTALISGKIAARCAAEYLRHAAVRRIPAEITLCRTSKSK